MKTRLIILLSSFAFLNGCGLRHLETEQAKEEIKKIESINYVSLSIPESNTDENYSFRLREDVLISILETMSEDNKRAISTEELAFKDFKNFDFNNNKFVDAFYGACWNDRPKTLDELEFPIIERTAFKRINELDINLLKILNIGQFSFNRKNRIYVSEASIKGKHICNERIFNYSVSLFVIYRVKTKDGGITINNLKQLGANITAKKVEASYEFKSVGVKINFNYAGDVKIDITESGLFNEKLNLDIDGKLNYFLKEISKSNGAFIGVPYPDDFNYIKE